MHNFRNPSAQPYPKKVRIKLSGKDKSALRKALYDRSKGRCETCGQFVPLFVYDYGGQQYFDEFRCGHTSHGKSVGSGGDDTLENTKYECMSCHFAKHSGRV